jgi:hypothetical protein
MTEKKTTRFKPGQSGNPGGRPVGSGSLIRAQLMEEWESVKLVLLAKAKEGDMAAIRIIAERVMPPIKAVELPAQITMPAGSLADQGRAVLAAAGNGELAPGQAAQLLAGLGALAKLIETDDLVARIAALEAKHGNKP